MNSHHTYLIASACVAALALSLPACGQSSSGTAAGNTSTPNSSGAIVHPNPTGNTANARDRGMSGDNGITKEGSASNSNTTGSTTGHDLQNAGDEHAAAGNNKPYPGMPSTPATLPSGGMAGGVHSGSTGASAGAGSAGSSGNTGSLGSLGIGQSGSGMDTGSNASGDQHSASNH
ncbi:MAG TPA: hypothetical protein VH253_03705 [Phycisphaerae bacterium]|nr:hypothetical protein [Phycisphaerae bacterium]